MKIVLITNMTPASENIRGTSALPYHLMVHRPSDIEIKIYSFNYNNLDSQKILVVEKELDASIELLPQPRWLHWVLKLKIGIIVRMLMKYPPLNYLKLSSKDLERINSHHPDGIWIYGEEMSRIAKQFCNYKRVHTLPDCESLYYYRMLGQRFVFSNWRKYWASAIMYPKFLRMEREFDHSSNIHYYLVGEEDANSLKNIRPGIQAHFIHHPHYDLFIPEKIVVFHQPKIKLLIAGQYNLYMKQDADLLINELTTSSTLQEHYEVTFLGKGWENHVSALRASGFQVSHIRFAENYIEEVVKHDIQVTPICIGTGTKGKVLDAIVNGLLVIGSEYALENICVEHEKHCLKYQHVKEVVPMLEKISSNISIYEKMAMLGRDIVMKKHSRKTISTKMFSLFN